MAYNEIFNIGADQPYTINELAWSVASAMGVKPDIRYVPARNEVKNIYSSHAKLQAVFGKREPMALTEGLQCMADWVKLHGARRSKRFDAIEVAKNFPAAWND
jgi:UDP-glucose 4-epimerase